MQSQATSKQERECYIVCMRLRSKGKRFSKPFCGSSVCPETIKFFDEGHRVAAADNDYAAAAAAD